jgi:hypothetical protein
MLDRGHPHQIDQAPRQNRWNPFNGELIKHRHRRIFDPQAQKFTQLKYLNGVRVFDFQACPDISSAILRLLIGNLSIGG